MAKPKQEKPQRRSPGPKTKKPVIPEKFTIARPVNPFQAILQESDRSFAEIEDQIEDRKINSARSAETAKIDALAPQTAEIADLAGSAKTAQSANSAEIANIAQTVKVAESKGELRIPNTIVDNLLPTLDPSEAVVYLRLYRLSYGFRKDHCVISTSRLAESTKQSERTVHKAVALLEKIGLVKREQTVYSSRNRGNLYRVFLPQISADSADSAIFAKSALSADSAGSAYNKRDLKKQYLKIRGELSELFVGGSFDQFRAAFIRRCEGKGIEFDSDLFKVIFGG